VSIARKHAYRFGYLKSEQWQNVRLEVLVRDGGKCRMCGHFSLSNDVHHCYYPKDVWETQPTHCITLCRECHDKIHNSKPNNPWAFAHKELKPFKRRMLVEKCSSDPTYIERLRQRYHKLLNQQLKSVLKRAGFLSLFSIDNGVILNYRSDRKFISPNRSALVALGSTQEINWMRLCRKARERMPIESRHRTP